jgi:predicted GNAT family N-acyltransferase
MVVSARPGPRADDPASTGVAVLPGPPPAAARALRTTVFVEEQGVPAELEHDDADPRADHAVILAPTGEALATARLLDPAAIPGLETGPAAGADAAWAGDAATEPIGVIGRVAVRPEARGRGLAKAVTVALERRATERGLTTIRLHAQVAVAGLYEGLGYRVFGPPDRTAGIDHVWMARPLLPGLRPVRDTDGPALEVLIGDAWSEYEGCVLDVDAEEPWMRLPATTYTGDHAQGPGRYRGAMWVVEDASAPAGLAASVAVRETGERTVELKSLYVSPAARRRGLGAALVHRVERETRRRGAETVELWTDTRFTDAHRLYERLGYVATGETRDLNDLSHTTEYRYTRRLPVVP